MPYMYSDGFVYMKNPDGSRGKKMNKKRMSREHADRYMKALYANADADEKSLVNFRSLPDNKWIAFYSNNFEDLASEIFTEKSIDKFIAMMDTKQYDMPSLFFWHVPYPLGKADWIGRIGHTLVAVGHYENIGGDKEIYEGFRKYFKETDDIFMVSHGYLYHSRDKSGDAYDRFLTFEISPIPVGDGIPANLLTVFKEVEEIAMAAISKEKRAKLEEILGVEATNRLLQIAEKHSEEIEALRLRYKEKSKKDESDDEMMEEEPDMHEGEESDSEEKKEEEDKKKKTEKKESVAEPVAVAPPSPPVDVEKITQQVSSQVSSQMSSQVTQVNDRVKELEAGIKELAEFIKLQFSTVEPATKSEKTRVSKEDDQVKHLIDENTGKSQAVDNPLRAMFPMFFEDSDG